MTTYNAVYFRIVKYHAGTSWSLEDASPIIHSDTVFSGLVWSYLELYGNDEARAFIEECCRGSLRMSSLYPVKLAGKRVETFPTPLAYIVKLKEIFEEYSEKNRENASRIKPKEKIYLVSKRLFEKLIRGTLQSAEEMVYNNGVLYSCDEECTQPPVEDREREYLRISRITVYRNVKDRRHGLTTPWRLSYYALGEGCGLRLIYTITKSLSEKKFRAAVRLLSENGLGGERSLGLGCANEPPVFTDIEINEPIDAAYFTTLSLYHPLQREVEEYAEREAFYELVERGGFTDPRMGGFRVPRIRMFREGSVLPLVESQLGRVVDVGGVYRYGFAFPIKIKRGW